MIAVTGAARPAARRRSLRHVEDRRQAGLVVGEVDDHDRFPSRKMFSRPGERSTDGRKSRNPSRDLCDGRAHGPGATRGSERVGHVVPRKAADRDRDVRDTR